MIEKFLVLILMVTLFAGCASVQDDDSSSHINTSAITKNPKENTQPNLKSTKDCTVECWFGKFWSVNTKDIPDVYRLDECDIESGGVRNYGEFIQHEQTKVTCIHITCESGSFYTPQGNVDWSYQYSEGVKVSKKSVRTYEDSGNTYNITILFSHGKPSSVTVEGGVFEENEQACEL